MQLVGYVRVSRVGGREGETFISPDVQRERIEGAAVAGGHRVVDWKTDLDEPGSRYERPGFQEALEAVERGEAGGVAVASLDRFARSVADAGVALRRLEAAGGILISARDALDTSTPVGRFARTMMLAIAELELDRIRENWRVATERAIARGVHVSRVPPFGYRRDAGGRLEPDPRDAPTLREIFLRRAAGDSWREIARFLDERAPREEGGAWPITSIFEIVQRRAYLGEAANGSFRNVDAHPALVSLAEWQAAQPARGRSWRRPGSLLAGLVRCAACDGAMTTGRDGRRGYRSYLCRKRRATGVCPAPTRISVTALDRYVEELFLGWLAAHPVRLEGVASSSDAEQALAAIETAERELVGYRDAELVSVVGADVFRAGLARRADALEEARRRYLEASRREPGRIVADLETRWPELTVAERAIVLREAVEVIEVVRGDRPTGGGRPPVESRVRVTFRPEIAGMPPAQDRGEGG